MSLLVLFDVDGTLLLTPDEVYVESNRDALLAVWGSAPDGPDVPGDTATAHTRRALRGAGFSDEEIDAGLDRWCALFPDRYVELLRDADTSHWQMPDGAAATLRRHRGKSRRRILHRRGNLAQARRQKGAVAALGQGSQTHQ